MENEKYEESIRLEIKKIEKAKKHSLAWLNGVLVSAIVYLTTLLVFNQRSKSNPISDVEGIIGLILIFLSSFGIGVCGVKTIDSIESLVKYKKEVKLKVKN